MFGIINLSAYLVAVAILVLLPGPNTLYCLAVAGRQGAKKGRRAIAGIFTGNSILIAASAFGAGTLLQAYPFLFDSMKLAGGAYLAYLGVQLLRDALAARRTKQAEQPNQAGQPAEAESVEPEESDSYTIFRKALTISLLNPQSLLFFPAMMVQFIDIRYTHPLLSFLVLGIIFQIFSLTCLNTMVPMAGSVGRAAAKHYRLAACGKIGAGTLFILFAAKLCLATMT